VTPLVPKEVGNLLKRVALGAVLQAEADLGKGEIGGNNAGRYVWSLTGRRTSGSWCAAAVYSWYLRSAQHKGLRMPIKRTHGARKLAKRIASVGRMLEPFDRPARGDVALWARGVPGSWMGHVGIVQVGGLAFTTIEGNRGKFPALVAPFDHHVGERRLLGFARFY